MADVQARPTHREAEGFEEALECRIAELTGWLAENGIQCEREQAHLDAGTPEQVYWHYGYVVALRDALSYLRKERRSLN